jgi:outer membrane protein assembly factor BamE (lipoprotein component of BamABCDE complex)
MTTVVPAKPWGFGRIVKYLGLTSVVVVAAHVAWGYWLFNGGVFATAVFEPSVWHTKQTNETDATCFRGGMANDVKNKVLKPGLSREAVKSLLGQPDSERPTKFEYSLGMCSGLRIDFDSLNVYFNENGVVASVAIVQH